MASRRERLCLVSSNGLERTAGFEKSGDQIAHQHAVAKCKEGR